MYNCPICNQPGIPVWRKLMLGPALPTTCRQCGKKVGVPWSSMLSVVPFLFAIIFSYYAFFFTNIDLIWLFTALVLSIIIMFFAYIKWIPLIPKEK